MNFNLTLIMQAVAFTAFIWFCARFIWPPLMRAIDTRQKQIADGLAAGEQGRKELAQSRKNATRKCSPKPRRGRPRSSRSAKSSRPRRSSRRRSTPRPKPTASSSPPRRRSSRNSQRAKEQLRDAVADLAVAGAAKILKKDVDVKAHADLLAQLKREL